jgi:hypothetical protein
MAGADNAPAGILGMDAAGNIRQDSANGIWDPDMRKSSFFFWTIAVQAAILGLLLAHAAVSVRTAPPAIGEMSRLVRALELTDLCLFTEARYTRHLSQADLNTPFQDYPLSLEHFPSGSFLAPPEGVRNINERLD